MKKILSLLSLILSIGAIPNFAQTESQDIIADYKQKMDSVLQFVDRETVSDRPALRLRISPAQSRNVQGRTDGFRLYRPECAGNFIYRSV